MRSFLREIKTLYIHFTYMLLYRIKRVAAYKRGFFLLFFFCYRPVRFAEEMTALSRSILEYRTKLAEETRSRRASSDDTRRLNRRFRKILSMWQKLLSSLFFVLLFFLVVIFPIWKYVLIRLQNGSYYLCSGGGGVRGTVSLNAFGSRARDGVPLPLTGKGVGDGLSDPSPPDDKSEWIE